MANSHLLRHKLLIFEGSPSPLLRRKQAMPKFTKLSQVVDHFNQGFTFIQGNDPRRCYLNVRYTGSLGYEASLLNVQYHGKNAEGEHGNHPVTVRGANGSKDGESAVAALIELLLTHETFRLQSADAESIRLTLDEAVENDLFSNEEEARRIAARKAEREAQETANA
jgi:hypothetical protein